MGPGDSRSSARQAANGSAGLQSRLATAKLLHHLENLTQNACNVEKGSVYGAAILIPQVARSAGWPKFLSILAIRCYMFHVVNIIVQGLLLSYIAKETNVMNPFGSRMYLCDYGAFIGNCPGEPGCVGPGGTEISPPRVYSWEMWVTRVFARDSLLQLFPDKEEEIRTHMDPGEYGLESYYCRWLCCFCYMLSVMSELYLLVNMWRLLHDVPTKAQPWLDHKDDHREDEEWIDSVKVHVAGIPRNWKVFYFVTVFVPKALIWLITAEAGVTFLMETAGIADLIVNSVALSFVLNIDEMILDALMTHEVRTMLEMCEAFMDREEWKASSPRTTRDRLLQDYGSSQSRYRLRDVLQLVDFRCMVTCALTVSFVFWYYYTHCEWSEEHRFFSEDMYLPKSTHYNFLNAFFPEFFPVPTEGEPFFSMRSVLEE